MKKTQKRSAVRHNCPNCSILPGGGVEITAILLVLVFSLSAVLCTSVYAGRLQAGKVSALEAQLSDIAQ